MRHIYVILCDFLAVFFVIILFLALYKLLKLNTWNWFYVGLFSIIFVLFALILWSFFKSKIYDLLLKKRFSIAFYWRMVVIAAIWFVLYLIAMGILLLLKYTFFGREYIPTGLFFKAIFTLIPALVLLFALHSLISFLIFLRNNEKISESWKIYKRISLNQFGRFKSALLLLIVLFIVMDFISRPILKLDQKYYGIIVIVFYSFYFLIFRKYYVDFLSANFPKSNEKKTKTKRKKTAKKRKKRK